MIGVDMIGRIRRAYFDQHRPIKEIVRTLSVSCATVRKLVRSQAERLAAELARSAVHLSRALLHRVLAYRVQADALGDLDRETARALDRLWVDTDGAVAMPERPGTKPGTLLVREWEGTLQRVMVLERGFAWNGQTYDSLSGVARAITGTAWNGPRFFGLRGRAEPDRAGGTNTARSRPGARPAPTQNRRTATP